MTDSIIAVSSYVRKTITVAGTDYGLGKIRNSYFILNLDTDTWRSFTSKSAFCWFVDSLIEAGERIDPTPSAPASIRLIQSSVAAVQEPQMTTNRIAINAPAQTVGEWYNIVYTGDLCNAKIAFEAKHTAPTVIRLSKSDAAKQGFMTTYYGIPVEYSASIPSGKAWIGYNPADAKAA